MLPIFSKPIEGITVEDVEALVASKWPEGGTVEFKEKLPNKKGGEDPWMSGGSISDYARNEILAEVVAFANAHGGVVILGIAETTERPPRADAITPLPRCAELADRLINQARDCIEPKLPVLSVRGVQLDETGHGVMILRIPQSRLRPHRLEPTRHCYYRRADRSEKMTMRDIQELTLHTERGVAAIEKRFAQRREAFETWVRAGRVSSENVPAFGIRATAIPISADLYVERVYQQPEYLFAVRRFAAKVGQSDVTLLLPREPASERPILRGTRKEFDCEQLAIFQELQCDGLIEIALKSLHTDREDAGPAPVYLGWIMGLAVNAIVCAHRFRTTVGAPDVEYGLELEVMTVNSEMPLCGFFHQFPSDTFGPLSPNPLILQRLSIGSPSEFQRVINVILTDIFDAAGVRRTGPDPELIVDLADALEGPP